jgi:sugar lactone lactonase YvrE
MSKLCTLVAALIPLMAGAADYDLQIFVAPSPFHGVHGMDIGADGTLYAGDILGMTVHKVDIASGATAPVIGPPYGAADDVKVGPDGTLVWTNINAGIIYGRDSGGTIREIATGLRGINTVGFHPDGRLFATQPFGPNALYEIDLDGIEPPRIVLQPSGALNGFVIMDDGYLYGPQGQLGTVIRLDLETGDFSVLADGFHDPTGVKSDSKGTLYVNELATGTLYRLNADTGEKSIVAQLSPGNDNITISDDDLIYVSNFINSSIEEVNPKTGTVRDITRGKLSVPGGLAIGKDDDTEWLYVADLFTTRRVNTATGEIEIVEKTVGMFSSAYPSSVTINAEHLILSSWFGNAVTVLDLETFESVLTIRGLSVPHDAIELADGTFIIAETGANRVVQMSNEGKLLKVVADSLEAPIGLVQVDEDTVYVTEAAAGTVSSIALGSGQRTLISAGLSQPEGLSVDGKGRILVIEARARSLARIDPTTGRKEILLTDLPLGLQGPPSMHETWLHNDVAVGSDGTIYLSSDTETALYRVIEN